MPRPRRSNLSQNSRQAIRHRNNVNQSTAEELELARERRRVSMARLRASRRQEQRDLLPETANLNRAAFLYDCTIDYGSHPFVCIGPMHIVCEHCAALKFSGETPGLCCLNGKVKLPLLTPPPEPLHSLLRGDTPESRHFLANTQKYNKCFQMTSFGADIVEEYGFNPTFKVIYVEIV